MDARRSFESEFDGRLSTWWSIREDETAIAQMYRGVRPGGIMVLTVPQHRFLWSQLDVETYHQRRYTRRELLEKVERVGFQPIYVTSFVTLLLPVMFLWRLKYRFGKRRAPANFDVVKELQVNGMLNRPMSKIMDLELALIRKGLLLPVGGSLLVVARKPSEPAPTPAMAGLR
jgi:hypothetical protein